ncbi:MAG: hypothetical protein H8E46_09485 [FCB group bacterium]|nr:hypothetical protein [FCB group bacterium]
MNEKLSAGEGKVISFVPLTGKGKALYLAPGNTAGKTPSFNSVWNDDNSEVMHIGRKIELGGFLAWHHAYLAIRKGDGDLILVNGMASLEDGVLKLE